MSRLIADGGIDDDKLKEALEISDAAGLPILRVLFHMKLVDPAMVANAIAAVTTRQVLNLDRWQRPSPLPAFNEGLCRELRVFPLAFETAEGAERLVLGMSDPSDADAGVRVAALIGRDVRSVLVDDAALTRAIARRYDPGNPALSEATSEVLLDNPLTDSEIPTTEGKPESVPDDVFASSDADSIAEKQLTKPAQKFVRDTVLAVSPFLEPGRTDLTELRPMFGKLRVCFVSSELEARLRVAADLAPLVKEAIVLEDLTKAAKAVTPNFDEIIVYDPKNDVATGVNLDRLARAARRPVVVLSDDASFEQIPCVRRRIGLPPLGPTAIAPLILEELFSR